MRGRAKSNAWLVVALFTLGTLALMPTGAVVPPGDGHEDEEPPDDPVGIQIIDCEESGMETCATPEMVEMGLVNPKKVDEVCCMSGTVVIDVRPGGWPIYKTTFCDKQFDPFWECVCFTWTPRR